MSLEKFDQLLRLRVFGSAILFVAFVAVGTYTALAGLLADNPTPAVVLLLASYLLCPRKATPRDWAPETRADEHIERTRGRTEKTLRTIRLLYFVIAVFVLAILPFLLGDPVFHID